MRNLIHGLIYLSFSFKLKDAAIVPKDKTYEVMLGEENFPIEWVYDHEESMLLVTWLFRNSTEHSATTVMTQISGAQAVPIAGYNISHDQNGTIQLQKITPEYLGVYYCTVSYERSIFPLVTGTATIQLQEAPTEAPGTTECCQCFKIFKVLNKKLRDFLCIVFSIQFVVFCIILGLCVEYKFSIWGNMTQCQKIISVVAFLFGLGLLICYTIIQYFKELRYVVLPIGDNEKPLIIKSAQPCFPGVSIGAVCATNITHGGPAYGKLKVGDQIHEINGEAVTEENHNKIEKMINDEENITLRVSKVGILKTSYVKLDIKKGDLLGFEVEHLALVTNVTGGSKADGKVKKGDHILSINGKSTAGKSIGDVNKALKNPSSVLELYMKRGEEKRKVTLRFDKKTSSGITIKKEKENIVVSAIKNESAAASGDVKVKDCILSVNGVSTAGLQVLDIKEMLTFSIILKVTKDVTLKELDPDHNGSFGVEIFPDKPANIVQSVTPNGPAARRGIKSGDMIESINGKETKGKSHKEIKAMLETFGTSISLKIKENDKPHETNGLGGPEALANDVEMNLLNRQAQDSGRTLTPLQDGHRKHNLLKKEPLADIQPNKTT